MQCWPLTLQKRIGIHLSSLGSLKAVLFYQKRIEVARFCNLLLTGRIVANYKYPACEGSRRKIIASLLKRAVCRTNSHLKSRTTRLLSIVPTEKKISNNFSPTLSAA